MKDVFELASISVEFDTGGLDINSAPSATTTINVIPGVEVSEILGADVETIFNSINFSQLTEPVLMALKNKILSALIATICIFSFVGCTSNSQSTTTKNETKETTAKIETKQKDKEEKNIVLVDNDSAKITYKTIDKDRGMGSTLILLVENKSDKDIIVQTDKVSTDDMMSDTICSIEVAKGKKAEDELTLMTNDSKKDFKKVEGTFKILDSNYQEIASPNFKLDIN